MIRTIDAHTAGEPLRLVVEGWPEPRGRTMLERRAWARRHQDHLRRAIMFEPRGHADMYGALLTAPERPDSDTGVLFMHNEGFSTMCGHGIIAVVTLIIERGMNLGLAAPKFAEATEKRAEADIVLDAPAGQIRARAVVKEVQEPGLPRRSAPARGLPRRSAPARRRVSSVSFVNVPSFVLAPGVPVRVGGRSAQVDIAFGGAFYAVVDAESVGLAVTAERLPDLRRMGMAIKQAAEAAVDVVHPTEPGLAGIYGTIFTGPPTVDGADLRNVTIFADHEVDRSPCGTGSCAVLSVLDAMGLADPTRPFIHESVIGTTFSARVVARTTIGDRPAIVPELTGDAWITGEHTFLMDDEDPLRAGFRI